MRCTAAHHMFPPPAVFRVLSAVLHFGNLKFKQERSSDQALLVDDTIAQKISKLLGMPVTEFTKALLKPKIKTGREFTVRSQNMAQVGWHVEVVVWVWHVEEVGWHVEEVVTCGEGRGMWRRCGMWGGAWHVEEEVWYVWGGAWHTDTEYRGVSGVY